MAPGTEETVGNNVALPNVGSGPYCTEDEVAALLQAGGINQEIPDTELEFNGVSLDTLSVDLLDVPIDLEVDLRCDILCPVQPDSVWPDAVLGNNGTPNVSDTPERKFEISRDSVVSETATKGNGSCKVGETGKAKDCNPGAVKKSRKKADGTERNAAERQRRYRGKKKQKEREIELEVEALREKAEAMKIENSLLKEKQGAFSSMLNHNNDQLRILNGMQKSIERKENGTVSICSPRDHPENVEEACDFDTMSMEAIQEHIGNLYLDVLTSFEKEKQGKELICGTDFLSRILETIPPESMYRVFQEKVDTLLKQFDASRGDTVKQNEVEKDLKRLFQMRTNAVSAMAMLKPKLVLSHLVDGWVGETFDEGIVPGQPTRIDSATLASLVESVDVTDEQISKLCAIWKKFVASWNKVVNSVDKCVAMLPNDPNIQEEGVDQTGSDVSSGTTLDALDEIGLHGSMGHACFMHKAVQQHLNEVSQHQVYQVLELAQDICSVLTPVQKGRLCIFQKSSAPNCMFLPQMLATVPLIPRMCDHVQT
eukprot:jgi/Picsp_1/2234/NSC_05698-R1_---NA---